MANSGIVDFVVEFVVGVCVVMVVVAWLATVVVVTRELLSEVVLMEMSGSCPPPPSVTHRATMAPINTNANSARHNTFFKDTNSTQFQFSLPLFDVNARYLTTTLSSFAFVSMSTGTSTIGCSTERFFSTAFMMLRKNCSSFSLLLSHF